jgi:hypothetical protein
MNSTVETTTPTSPGSVFGAPNLPEPGTTDGKGSDS